MPVMDKLSQLWRRLLFYLRRDKFDRELEEEMRFHLEMKAEENLAAGISLEEARYAAQRQFGNQTLLREVSRDMWAVRSIETLFQDLRYGARILVKNPGFTFVAVLSLALGIGANTAIFTLMDAVLFKLLPVRDPEQLVIVAHAGQSELSSELSRSSNYPMYEFFRDHNRTLAGLSAFWQIDLKVRPQSETETVAGQFVTPNFFSVLGVNAMVGRTFSAMDENESSVVVLSHRLWERKFGADPAVVGKPLAVNGRPLTIIGVTPPDFLGLEAGKPVDVSLLLKAQPAILPEFGNRLAMRGSWWNLCLMGRLKSDVAVEQSRAELDILLRQWMTDAKVPEDTIRGSFARVELAPGSKGLDLLRRRFSKPLFVLSGIVGAILLIACANVANLLFARATTRRKEMGVRLALGARRGRLIRQMLTESVLLAALGGAAGVWLGWWGSKLLVRLISSGPTPVDLDVQPDLRALAFTAAVSVFTGILMGMAPALRGSAVDLNPALKEGGGSLSSHGSRWNFSQSLVAAQLALSLCLLIGAGLFVSTLRHLTALDAGFRIESLLLVGFDATGSGYKIEQMMAFYQQALERVKGLSGIRATSLSSLEPLSGDSSTRFLNVQGFTPATLDESVVQQNVISPAFFETMGIPLLRGREFTAIDGADAPKVAVVNETLARFYFGRSDPIGKTVRMGHELNSPLIEIIGVVKDSKRGNLRETPPRMIYLPFTQAGVGRMTLEVRPEGNPATVETSLRRVLSEVSRDVSIREIKTAQAQLERGIVQERMLATLSGFFGPLALLLATVGLYGVLAYGVTQRTREIGVRLALGAQRSDVLSLILWQGLKLIGIGVVIGLSSAFALTRLLQTLLLGVSPTDPLTFVVTPLLLSGVALLACWIPARRAMKVDPITVLRSE